MKRTAWLLSSLACVAGSVEAQTAYEDFADEVMEHIATGSDRELEQLVQTRPVHAQKFVHELLWQGLRGPASDPRWRNTAQRVAELSQRDDLTEAVAHYESLEGDSLAWAREFHAEYTHAVDAWNLGNWSEATEACQIAADLAVAAELPYLETRARRFAAEGLQKMGDEGSFRFEMEEVIRLEGQLGLLHDEALDREVLGRFNFENARWKEAGTQLLGARRAAKQANETEWAQRLFLDYGAMLSVQGDHAGARDVYTEVLAANEAAGDAMAAIRTRKTLGGLESALGNYGAAIAVFAEALDRAEAADAHELAAGLWTDLAASYSELGRTADAEDALSKALATLPEGEEAALAARLTLGLVTLDAGRAAEAVTIFASAVQDTDEPRLRARTRRLHGMALLEAGSPHAAREELREALAFQPGDAFENALAWSLLGEAHLVSSQLEAALSAFAKAIETSAGLSSREITWRAYAGLGRVQEQLGRSALALETYRKAIDDIEALRNLLVAPELRLAFLDRKRELYVRAARLCANTGDVPGAFRMAATAKARTLVEALRGGEGESLPLSPLSTGARVFAEQLAAAESSLRMIELRLGQSGQAEAIRAALLENRREARAARERARVGLQLADPRGASLLGWNDPTSQEELCALLADGEALVEYLLGETGVSAFVLRKSGATYFELDGSQTQIATLAARLDSPVHALRAGRTDIANLRFDVAAAKELHNLLIAPLQESLDGAHTLWIVPDGATRSISFAALVSRWERRPVDPARLYAQYEGCHFLVEDHAIGYLPSSSLLVGHTKRVGENGSALIVADPTPSPDNSRNLHAARGEAERIGGLLSSPTLLVGERATETALKQALENRGVTHFATHGTLDDRRPKYSRLALAPDPGEDGWLHAYEIESLRLGGRITLSACETLFPTGRAEGLLGLTRAFLAAGADSVLATLWAVDDTATANLMVKYYQNLADGHNALEALRQAQVATLSDRESEGLSYAHPFFWAAFVHVGER